MISNEMLEQVAKLDVEFLTFPPNHAQVAEMARELLALRKAFSEPVIYQAEINGVMSSVTRSHYDDCKKYGVKTRLLIIKPDLLE